jgi:hypothetical protein
VRQPAHHSSGGELWARLVIWPTTGRTRCRRINQEDEASRTQEQARVPVTDG